MKKIITWQTFDGMKFTHKWDAITHLAFEYQIDTQDVLLLLALEEQWYKCLQEYKADPSQENKRLVDELELELVEAKEEIGFKGFISEDIEEVVRAWITEKHGKTSKVIPMAD